MKKILCTAIVLIAFSSGTASSQTFTELDSNAGTYVADFGVVSGWRVIGVGDKYYSFCSAYKNEANATSFEPRVFGIHEYAWANFINEDTVFAFERNKPYSRAGASTPLSLRASGQFEENLDYEWRWQGEKFFNSLEYTSRIDRSKKRVTLSALLPHEGKSFEIKAHSWKYPTILAGYSDDSGSVSLSGLSTIQSRIEACEKKLIPEFPSHYGDTSPAILLSSKPTLPAGWDFWEPLGQVLVKNGDTVMKYKTGFGKMDAFSFSVYIPELIGRNSAELQKATLGFNGNNVDAELMAMNILDETSDGNFGVWLKEKSPNNTELANALRAGTQTITINVEGFSRQLVVSDFADAQKYEKFKRLEQN